MIVHMDGARFANALVALGVSPAQMSWKAGVDVLSLGTSKNGGIACEAVIFFNPEAARQFELQRKRAGHTLAKGRFLGAQMSAYLEGGNWLEAARQANFQAARLAAGLSSIPRVRLPWGREANLVFAVLPREIDCALREAGASYHEWRTDALRCMPAENEVFVRLATSFSTTSDEVDRFVSIAASGPEATARINAN
jgi:threonine aldolase